MQKSSVDYIVGDQQIRGEEACKVLYFVKEEDDEEVAFM